MKIYQILVQVYVGSCISESVLFSCSTRESAEEYKSLLENYVKDKEILLEVLHDKKFTTCDEVLGDYFYIEEISLIDTVFPSVKQANDYFRMKSKNLQEYIDNLPKDW